MHKGWKKLTEWFGRAIRYVWPDPAEKAARAAAAARRRSDHRRNIIEKYQATIQIHGQRYELENKTRDCIREIMISEGDESQAPKPGQYLYKWRNSQYVHESFKEYSKYVEAIFLKHRSQLEVEEARKRADIARAEERRRVEKRRADAQGLWDRNQDIIKKFLEIAERKVSALDEYGDERWELLPAEISAAIRKIAAKEGVEPQIVSSFLKKGETDLIGIKYDDVKRALDKKFRLYHAQEKPHRHDYSGMSGAEFEFVIASKLRSKGYQVSGTRTTGDQGADLLAKVNGRTIIIQVKRYQGPVGNGAVQEVIAALRFYGGDEGWVVTNSTFTPAARELARSGGIRLIEGTELDKL